MLAPIVWRAVFISLFLTPFIVSQPLSAQTAPAGTPSSSTSCNLEDGRQVYVRYNAIPSGKDKIPNGKPWTPGGAPMTLFTEAKFLSPLSPIPIL